MASSLNNHYTGGMDKEVRAIVNDFFSNYSEQSYSKGEIIIHPGETPSHIFYLTSGLVNEYDISQSGNEVVVNTFKTGAFFPMSLAVNPVENPYFFEVVKSTKMRKAPTEQVVALLHANPQVTFDLLSRVYRGTDGLLRRMAHLMGGKAKNRLLFELINAAHRHGTSTADGKILIPLSETDIAKRSGLSRETISRIIRTLREEHLVSVSPQGIAVHDIDRLEATLGSSL